MTWLIYSGTGSLPIEVVEASSEAEARETFSNLPAWKSRIPSSISIALGTPDQLEELESLRMSREDMMGYEEYDTNFR